MFLRYGKIMTICLFIKFLHVNFAISLNEKYKTRKFWYSVEQFFVHNNILCPNQKNSLTLFSAKMIFPID